MNKTKPYFDEIDKIIIDELTQAKYRIIVAVAWITNEAIIKKLISKSNEGLIVEVIVDDNRTNRNNNYLQLLNDKVAAFDFIKNLNKSTSIMHNKFCVIDNKKVITGSYNWTENAKTNDENIVVIEKEFVAMAFALQFRKIKLDYELKLDVPRLMLKIEDDLYSLFINLIKSKILPVKMEEKNLIFGFSDERIKSRIQSIMEYSTAEVNTKLSSLWKFWSLIEKYGVNWKDKSNIKEQIRHEEKYWKKQFLSIKESIEFQFAIRKKNVIEKIVSNYTQLLKSNIDSQSQERILKLIIYMNTEKLKICTENKINTV